MMTPEEFELWQQYHADDEAAQRFEMWQQFVGCVRAQEYAEETALRHAAEAEIRKFQENFPTVVQGLRAAQLRVKEIEDFKSRFGTDAEFLRQCGVAPIE